MNKIYHEHLMEQREAKSGVHLFDIPCGVDDSDHLVFFCPVCDVTMEVQRATTSEMPSLKQRKVTRFMLRCPNCRGTGCRKIYWKEAGGYCTHRTDKMNPPKPAAPTLTDEDMPT